MHCRERQTAVVGDGDEDVVIHAVVIDDVVLAGQFGQRPNLAAAHQTATHFVDASVLIHDRIKQLVQPAILDYGIHAAHHTQNGVSVLPNCVEGPIDRLAVVYGGDFLH